MYQLSHMITDQRNLLSELAQFSVTGEKVDYNEVDHFAEEVKNSSSSNCNGGGPTKEVPTSVKSDYQEGRKRLLELLEKVEGCSHVIDVPTRHLLHNGDLVEMDISENTALHRVHGYLTDDGFMVATWLPNRRGPVR